MEISRDAVLPVSVPVGHHFEVNVMFLVRRKYFLNDGRVTDGDAR